jgi:hypothetical protein
MGVPLKLITLLAALLLLFPVAAFPQGATGGLRGQVTDPSGAAVAGAKVIVTPATGKALTVDTGRDGSYEVKNLTPGKYAVDVIAKGFAPFEVLDFEISAGAAQKLDVKLDLAAQEEKVVVEGVTPTVDVSPESNVGAIVMTEKDLEALSDDPDDLQNDLTALAGPSAGPNGGQIYIDGFTAGQLPPKSAIREIRINQNPFSTEYDKLGYGRVEIFTKPGSNQWHGEVNVQGNTAGFNSKNPFAAEEPSYYSTLYNGNIGGPLGKKTSIFFNFQYRDINDVSVIHATGPECLQNASCYSGTPPNVTKVPLNSSAATPRRRLNLGPRVDYQLTPTNTLNVRYQYERNDQSGLGLTSGFALAPQAYGSLATEHQLQVGDTQVFGTNIVNETRFQFLHEPTNINPVTTTALQVSVPGAFTDGGNAQNLVIDTQNRYEFQNYTQILHKNHTIKFGVRFREFVENNTANTSFNGNFSFPSLQAYDAALLVLNAAGAPPAVQVKGAQFFNICVPGAGGVCITSAATQTTATEFDAGPYIQDDWRVRPNLTLSAGLRIESQTGISDHLDWAPRVALAWGIARGKNPPKTVLRVGSGIFYDRFLQNLILQAERLNGTVQLQNVVNAPCFALLGASMTLPLNVAECKTLPGPPPMPATALPTVYRIAPNLHAPGLLQTAVVLERQLTKTANLSLTYLNSRGWDQLLTNNINTPLLGTYSLVQMPAPTPMYPYCAPGVPAGPTCPNGTPGNIYQYQSEGVLRQNQFIAQLNIRAGQKFSITSYYTLNYANSDTAGANSFPSNPYNLQQDYGRAAFDIRNRLFVIGTFAFPHGIRLSPFVIASSGTPYSVTLSQDLIGSSQFNQRPAAGATGPCVTSGSLVCTPVGNFETLPAPGGPVVPINSLTGPAHFTFNLRVSKTWGFGEKPERAGGGGGEAGGGGGGGPRGPGRGPGGMGSMGMGGLGSATNKRYNLTLTLYARNIFNYTNLSTPTAFLNPPLIAGGNGSISPAFGLSNSLQGGAFSSQSASRVIYLQLGFSF